MISTSVKALPEWPVETVTTDTSLLANDVRRAMSTGLFDASVNKTFMCFTGTGMAPLVAAFDHDLKRWGDPVRIPIPDSSTDNHDYPHLFQSADGHLHITYSRHNESLWIASSENPNSIEGNWNVREIGSNLKATYPMPVKASDGTLYILYRVTLSPTDYRPIRWVKSTDNGQTWSATPTPSIDYGDNLRSDNMNEIYLGQLNYEPDHPFGEGYGASWTLAGGGPNRNDHDDYHKNMYYAFTGTRGYKDFNRIDGKLWMLKDNGNGAEVNEFDGSIWTPVATFSPPLNTETIFIDDPNPEVLVFAAQDTEAIYSVGSVALPDIPALNNPSATVSYSTSSADLSVSLEVDSQADVWFVWDTVDQGTNLASWTNSQYLTAQGSGTVTAQASGLQEGVDYVFRAYASNSEGSTWTSAKTFTVLPVNYTLLEDFESRILDSAIKGQGSWGGDTSSADEFSVQSDPEDANNQVLWFNQGVDKEVFLNPSDLRIEDNQTSTVFFRIRAVPSESGAAALWLRMTLSDVLSPSDFGDGETDISISDNGSGSLILSGIADPLAQARWYQLWFVVDNANNSDGFSDHDEWLAGTNPTDVGSFFRSSINTLNGTPATITITWPSLTDRSYSIEARGNLLEGTWTPIVSDIPGEASSTSHTFTIEEPSMFFRVQINP